MDNHLDRRLDTYFTTLRSSLTTRLKRRAGDWHLYAAVGGSARAMATGLSAAAVGTGARPLIPAPTGSSRTSRRHGFELNNIALKHPMQFALAFNQNTAASSQEPVITPGGIAPLFSNSTSSGGAVQTGQFIAIKGTNLATQTASWNNDFPTSLGGTSVEIDGRPAYLIFVSPTLITVQVPDDTATGPVQVVVTTAVGSTTSSVVLATYAPEFNVLNNQYVSGIILRSNGSGAFGGGSYDILGPDGNSFGYPTVAAVPGDSVELFGSGFGPTNPVVPAGQLYNGMAPITTPFTLYINDIPVQTTFVGITGPGQYQVNLTVPVGLGQGEVPIRGFVGTKETSQLLFSLRGVLPPVSTSGGFGSGGTGGFPGGPVGGGFGSGGTFGGSGGGTGGGSAGGSGGGSGGGGGSARPAHNGYYQPRLHFGGKR